MHDVGAGGINVQWSSSSSDVHGLTLEDSDIYDGGHVYLMGPGVLLQQCHDCLITHNHIHDFFYTGISTGSGFKAGRIADTVLSYNELNKLGQKLLSDMGAVYVWGGNQSGLVVDHNLCHDVSSYDYGGWGLYNDQTTSGVTHTNNVVYNTEGACYHDHEGFDVSLSNNIFVMTGNGSDGALRSASPTGKPDYWHAAFKLETNIVYSTGGNLFTAGSDKQWGLSTFDKNVYWRVGHSATGNLFPDNQTLTEWQETGVSSGKLGGEDHHSVVADPMFTDVAAHDYTLLPGSPALNLGFKQVDMSTVGPRPRV